MNCTFELRFNLTQSYMCTTSRKIIENSIIIIWILKRLNTSVVITPAIINNIPITLLINTVIHIVFLFWISLSFIHQCFVLYLFMQFLFNFISSHWLLNRKQVFNFYWVASFAYTFVSTLIITRCVFTCVQPCLQLALLD